MIIHPEVRWDWAASDAAQSIDFADESDFSNFVFDVEAILTF